jgi:hypothetical protein
MKSNKAQTAIVMGVSPKCPSNVALAYWLAKKGMAMKMAA